GVLGWERRRYRPGDLDGCFLAIGATGDAAANQAMFAEAEAAGRLCNIVDVPELCNFILPALLRRGEVTVAVSTAGASPTLAQRGPWRGAPETGSRASSARNAAAGRLSCAGCAPPSTPACATRRAGSRRGGPSPPRPPSTCCATVATPRRSGRHGRLLMEREW